MRETIEGMRAVCAVLEGLCARADDAPCLVLAQRHLDLLARRLARGQARPEPAGPSGAVPAAMAAGLAESHALKSGGSHARQ